jgi:iron(III) transport system substrate-binding protein
MTIKQKKGVLPAITALAWLVVGSFLAGSLLVGCSAATEEERSLTIYSGRSEVFIAPFLEKFTAQSGIKLNVRYGDSAELAAQILEEGKNSPADLFLSQDAGSLGAVSEAGLLSTLPAEITSRVGNKFLAANKTWVGITGRARVFAYAPDRVRELPLSIDDLSGNQWKNRLAIAPTNSSFQAFITAMINSRGEAATESWLKAIKNNGVKLYEKNSLIVSAIDSGEVDLGLVNHYYTWEVSKSLGREINVKNGFFAPGDVGNLINASGAGVLATSKNVESAESLINFLLSDEVQRGFVSDTHEYSLVLPELSPEGLPALNKIASPAVDLAALRALARTQELLIKVGLI